MTSSYTTNKNIEKPANGDYNNTWSTPVNSDWDLIDKAFGGTTSLNVVSVSGTVTLTTTQYQPPIINISGTLTANINYQLPSGVGGFWFIYNNTSGAFSITFSSAGGGTSVTLSQGTMTAVISDGTNIRRSDTNTVGAGGSNTQVQFNNNGVFGGSSALTWDGTVLSATSFSGAGTGLTGTAAGLSIGGNAATATTATTAGNISGVAAIANGGTGQTTASAALAALGGLAVAASSLNTNGYIRLSNGLMIQWGVYTTSGGEGSYTVSFPTSFPTACFTAVATIKGISNTGNDIWVQVNSVAKSSMSIQYQSGGGNTGYGAYWIAIGN